MLLWQLGSFFPPERTSRHFARLISSPGTFSLQKKNGFEKWKWHCVNDRQSTRPTQNQKLQYYSKVSYQPLTRCKSHRALRDSCSAGRDPRSTWWRFSSHRTRDGTGNLLLSGTVDPTITNKILLTNYSCIIDKWVKQEPRYHITLLKQTYFPATFYRIHKRTKKNRTSRKVVLNVSSVHTTSAIKYQGIFKDFLRPNYSF